MNRPIHASFRIAVVVCFVLILAIMAAVNAPLFVDPIGRFLGGASSFADMRDAIASGYASDELWLKDDLVNLNGLFVRSAGRRVYDGVMLLKNGMLAPDELISRTSMEPTAERMGEFSAWLAGRDIPFLYALVPYKVDSNPWLLPREADFHMGENGTELLEALRQRGVETVDLRTELSSTVQQLDQYFYRTDRHWNAEGAFRAFSTILRKLQSLDISLDAADGDVSRWELHGYADWYLGGEGQRVGSLFAGTDSMIWYTPQFDTEMSCIIPQSGQIFKGSFAEANLREKYIETPNYSDGSIYSPYIGGDYPLVQHRNALAPNKKRVLLIKDSFMLPVQAFFSTVFSEVDVIDPRSYTATTLAEYCAWTKPDLVIMMTLPSSASSDQYADFGVATAPAQVKKGEIEGRIFLDNYKVPVEPKDSDHNFARILAAPEPGVTYQISFKDVTIQAGHPDGFSVVLFNWAENRVVAQQVFDINYCHQTGGDSWTFKTPQEAGNYGILIYAGIYGNTYGNGITLTGVRAMRMP